MVGSSSLGGGSTAHLLLNVAYNHSGKFGQVNFLNGPMGIANAQRALDYIRIFTEFISQVGFVITYLSVSLIFYSRNSVMWYLCFRS